MRTTTHHAFLTFAALGAFATAGTAQDPYTVDPYATDSYGQGPYDGAEYVVEDSLEARVWLDRGDEPVVDRGDEVRVYYRTSQDAYAAIFRIDTDGRISLLYPQHPDADPYVMGGRDFRLVFPEGARWRVREDPGVGYFFMVASYEPLDFSAFGFDPDYGWDLSEVGGTVYEDPYVAIDDYVAAVLPNWEAAGYALDFLEYSVGEEHDYPRFLCYDCHDYRPYARWDPYARACSSFQVVIWDDPYFYPRFRYAGTRVVFARPIGPRPRYSVTARLVGSGPRPIVRSRPAPPRRTAVYKEIPGRATSVVPRRNPPTAAPAGRYSIPSSPSGRATAPPRPSARRGIPPVARPGSARYGAGARSGAPARAGADARSGAAAGARRQEPPLPSARRGVPPTTRPGAAAGSSRERERPTLQRRPPRASGQPAASPRERARPSGVRPPGGRPSGVTPSRARPSRPSGAGARSAPSRPPPSGAQPVPNRPPPSGTRAPSRPPRSGPAAAPNRPPGSSGTAGPTRPPRSGAGPSPGRRPPPAAGSPANPSRGSVTAERRRRPGG